MSFLWIESLWLLLLVPALVAVYILIQRRRQKYALRYSSLSIVKEALTQGPGFKRHIPPLLFLIGLVLIIFALARPIATVILPSQQGTIILTIDVSMSMRANDFKPNRLEAAKASALAFAEKQPKGVRIGVVSFSGTTAIVQAPTTDREAVAKAISRLTMQSRTAIGSGILTSLDAIFEEPGSAPAPVSRDTLTLYESKLPPPPVSRGTYAPAVVILLSDGMSNTGPRPLDVVDQAANRGVRIYTVGVGTVEGGTLDFGGYAMRLRVDEETLKSIAFKTDGKYFKAGNETELLNIYDNLGTQLVFKPEETEVTAIVTGAAALLMVMAGVLSLLWFNKLP